MGDAPIAGENGVVGEAKKLSNLESADLNDDLNAGSCLWSSGCLNRMLYGVVIVSEKTAILKCAAQALSVPSTKQTI